MLAHSWRRRRWLDRNAGLLIAMVLVPSLLGAMIFIRVPPPEDNEPIPIKVLYEAETPPEEEEEKTEPEPAPEPEPEPEEPAPPPPMDPLMMETVATRPGSQEQGDQIVDPVPGEPADGSATGEEDGMDPEQPGSDEEEGPVSLQDWVPTTDQAAELQAIGSEVAGHGRTLQTRRQKLRESIIRAEVVSAAKDFELSSDGGMEGAIRTLNIDGFPQEIVDEVFQRYDIIYERRHIKASPGRNFLNAATTGSGTYRNVAKEGFFNVMTLSPKAMSFMVKLEVEALQARGFEPRNTRVRKIIFGIVKDKHNRFDLGVIDLETEKIR